MKKILLVGQAVKPTGYARVLRSIFAQLRQSFDLVQFGLDHRGPIINSPWPILPNRRLGDPFGVEQLPAILAEHRPEVVFICHDYFLYSVYQESLRHATLQPQVVFYCLIEYSFPDDRLRGLAEVDYLVAYTEFGRDILDAALGGVRPARDIEVLPHGVDTTHFYPLCGAATTDDLRASRMAARERLWPNRRELRNAFIALNANRNSPRKRIDITLEGFAEFARHRPDAWLYLHMGMLDVGVNVLDHARQFGIADRLLVSTTTADHPTLDDEHLNLVYNACDVGLNTSTGEGFGLVALEHGATGAAQVLPNHSACAELWRGAAHLLPIPAYGPASRGSLDYGLPRPADVATALGLLADDAGQRETLSLRAHTLATDARFDWGSIAAHWHSILAEA